MIYVVCELGDVTGPVKVGVTGRYAASRNEALMRVNNMQTSTWRQLVCIAITDGGEADERALHQRFASAWVRGEWFARTPDVAAFIATNACEPIAATSGATRDRMLRTSPIGDPVSHMIDPDSFGTATMCGSVATRVRRALGREKFTATDRRCRQCDRGLELLLANARFD